MTVDRAGHPIDEEAATRARRLDEHRLNVGDYVVVELLLPGRIIEARVEDATDAVLVVKTGAGARPSCIRWDAIGVITTRTTNPPHPAL